jgi:hypothetical protein
MKYFIFTFLIFVSIALQSQVNKKFVMNGYVSFMNSNSYDSIDNQWMIDNLLHNRLNFYYYHNDNLSFSVQLRNRLMWGESMNIPNYAGFIEKSNGFLNLSKNIIEEQSFLLNSNIDRFYAEWTKDKWEIQIGRQRINWGRTLVWNPNDIFNSASYFDFDYVEKPGSDAVRVKYYPNYSSSIEFASAINHDSSFTVAAKYLFNKWNYDFQFLVGEMREQDFVMGFGYAGNIKNIGFKGEITSFMPYKVDSLENTFSATMSFDYMISDKFNVLGQILFFKVPKNSPINNLADYYTADLSAKNLSFTEWNIFAQGSYQITPLLNAYVGAMYFPEINGYFINPGFDFSLSQNVDFSFIYQYFRGEFPLPGTSQISKQQLNFLFLRTKWSF